MSSTNRRPETSVPVLVNQPVVPPDLEPATNAWHVYAISMLDGSLGLPTPRCYKAGVEAWRRAHPDHAAVYAGKQAVAVILAAKEKFLLRVG